ncbi:acrosin-like protein [Dinothrombium tinctorium]|uniref:Acrosin-like protein n=1 Tax=Dinothrombium tinctorium TaxID=1965070 RepID=A0A3S3PAJ8_9ACAR|nr:acrosin-like protein [Dinothrombium tinctorium]RWS08649.1 acrosin-like protein [Dinothrombium tinctorium]
MEKELMMNRDVNEHCATVTSVVGGKKLEEKYSYPWMASIKLYKRYDRSKFLERYCTGIIINKRLILTAASCFTIYKKVVEVTLGSANGTVFKTLTHRWKVHEDFNKKGKSNDLAVIKLNEEIVFDDYKKPICLPKASLSKTSKRLSLIDFNKKFQNRQKNLLFAY